MNKGRPCGATSEKSKSPEQRYTTKNTTLYEYGSLMNILMVQPGM